MYYTIRFGTDGIGLDFHAGVFADSIPEARTEAATRLYAYGYGITAERGLFTVHGHRSWVLENSNGFGYQIVPEDDPGRPVPDFPLLSRYEVTDMLADVERRTCEMIRDLSQ